VQNLSGKTITNHWGFVTARYADGNEVNRTWDEDLLEETILTGIPGVKVQSPRTLRNGETRNLTVLMPPGADGSAPIYVSGHPSALIFEDRTALGNVAQIKMTLEFRRVHAEDLLDVVERLHAIRAHPGVLEAVRANADPVKAIRDALSEQVAKPRTLAVPEERNAFRITQLQSLTKVLLDPRLDMPLNFLDGVIQREEAVQTATSEQSTLKEAQ
jgi:hypothetical protein